MPKSEIIFMLLAIQPKTEIFSALLMEFEFGYFLFLLMSEPRDSHISRGVMFTVGIIIITLKRS